jgi:CubicO group peptidase (beta-lactamase class C family)
MSKIKIQKKNSPLFIILIVTLLQTINLGQQKDLQIAEVENGLLPIVLLEGEPSFNIEERMKHYKIAGLSVAVIKDFKIEWYKHYGVMDAELKNPVTDETIFNVGSLSKGVSALTVLSLADEGKVDLYKDVNQQLTSWKIPENEFSEQGTVTPFLLMNHTGGAMFSPPFSYLSDNFPTILQVLKGEKPAKFKPMVLERIPGTEFLYSNAGYSTLQLLTTDVANKSYPEITKEEILDPLNMNKSTFQQPLPEKLVKYASAGHMRNGLPLDVKRYYYPHMAAGGLWSTTYDYAKYVIELQKSYLNKSNKIIPQELAKKMLSSQVAEQYGLGVFIREIKGEKNYFGHMGDNRGFFAGFVSHKTDGNGAIVFTNSQNGPSIIREITSGIAKVYGWEKYLPDEYKIVDLPNQMLEKYCGRFSLGSDGLFEIKKDQNKLFINQFGNLKLYHVGNDKFVTKFRDGFIQFYNNSEGNISSANYHLADELGRFMTDSLICPKMKDGVKLPIELLRESKIAEAIDLYRKIKIDNPNDTYVSENRFNMLGYNFMGKGKLDEAIAVFKFNVEFYPNSGNSYDSLGEAFMKNGKTNLAIKNYKKALELNPDNTNAVTMLNKLQNE